MFSVVIPTLQKNETVLINLLKILVLDKSSGEIIIIDNSLKGINFKDEKIKVITPKENMYVNPSWNLGVKEAKYDKIALLNDDIAIPDNFLAQISPLITSEIGIVGMNKKFIEQKEEIKENPKNSNSTYTLEKINYRGFGFGCAMFFHKSSYFEIPNEIKIVYGDDWLIYKNKENKKQNYILCNQTIYHLGSISSGLKTFNPVCKNDAKIYKKLTVKWYQRIFSLDECWDCRKIRILGLTVKILKKEYKYE